MTLKTVDETRADLEKRFRGKECSGCNSEPRIVTDGNGGLKGTCNCAPKPMKMLQKIERGDKRRLRKMVAADARQENTRTGEKMVVYQAARREIVLNFNHAMAQFGCKNEAEAWLFMRACEAWQADPFAGEVSIPEFGGTSGVRKPYKEIKYYKRKMEEHRDFLQFRWGNTIKRGDKVIFSRAERREEGDELLGGWAKVWRKGDDKDDPSGDTDITMKWRRKGPMWDTNPEYMIKKQALKLAIDDAFPGLIPQMREFEFEEDEATGERVDESTGEILSENIDTAPMMLEVVGETLPPETLQQATDLPDEWYEVTHNHSSEILADDCPGCQGVEQLLIQQSRAKVEFEAQGLFPETEA